MVVAASKQAVEATGLPKGSSSSNSAPATPMFTYHTLAHPLQDASNLPSGHVNSGASVPQQAPSEFAPVQGHWQQGQSSGSCPEQGHWQQGQPSRSSSDCFSMDPAQLEADIAALTSAIAEEAAGLDGVSEGVLDYHEHSAAGGAAHTPSSRPSTQLDSHAENEGSCLGAYGTASKGAEAQYPQQYLPQSPQRSPRQSLLQQPPGLTQPQVYRHTGQRVEVPVAALSKGAHRTADRHRLDHQEVQEQPSILEDR